MVEARIAELKAEGILPIQPAAHRIRRLPIRQPLHELQHRDHGQAPRRLSRLSSSREEVGEVLVMVERAQRVAQLHNERAVGEAGAHDVGSLLGHRRDGQDFE